MDTAEKNTVPQRRLGTGAAATIAAVIGLAVGLGAGIGIGAGIWKEDCAPSSNTALGTSSVCDTSVEHDDSLITYVLSVGEYEMKQRPGAEFIDVFVPRESLPSTMPYLINDVKDGALYENVLNTTMFLEDWSALSLQTNESNGEFAMPAYAAAKQCYQDYDVTAQASSTPPNAMVIRHDETNVDRLVHVYNVTEEADRFVFTLLPVRDDEPSILREGGCHPRQNMSAPHFHHVSTCTEYDANWVVGENGMRGTGLTAFIKLGPLIDTGVAAVGADLIASGGADAAVDAGVDAGVDAASDAGSDAVSDATSDSGYNGDDIVSDASSDGASDRADTVIGEQDRPQGWRPGFGTAVGTAGTLVGTTAALAPEAEAPPGSVRG